MIVDNDGDFWYLNVEQLNNNFYYIRGICIFFSLNNEKKIF